MLSVIRVPVSALYDFKKRTYASSIIEVNLTAPGRGASARFSSTITFFFLICYYHF